MGKHFFERRCHYSIRKFAIGAASVMIGASIFGAGMVQAAETEGPAETEGTVTQVQPLDKLPADIAAAIEKAESAKPTDPTETNPTDAEAQPENTGEVAPKPAETPVPKEEATPKPAETPTPNEEVASQPATNPKEEVASDAKPAASPVTKDVVDTPDVNHLEKATATASNHEANNTIHSRKGD